MLKAAGVPTNDYQSFLLKLKEEYPIISAVRTDKTSGKTSDMLNDYKLLQYYRLFDWEDK